MKREWRQITRNEFCKLTKVSRTDPVISAYWNGEYVMPAFGIRYYEITDDEFIQYIVIKPDKRGLYKFMFRNPDDDGLGLIARWIYDEKEKFGGHWQRHKLWQR